MLGEIIDATDARIVISSSWRGSTLELTKKTLSDPTGPFMNNMIFPFLDKVVGVTSRIEGTCYDNNFVYIPRGVEIEYWLNKNAISFIKSSGKRDYIYVILDDDSDMLYNQKDHFVHTDSYEGLTKKDVQKAIKILNNK